MLKKLFHLLAYPIHYILTSHFLYQLSIPKKAKRKDFYEAVSYKKYKYKHVNFGYNKGKRLYLNGERSTLELEYNIDDVDKNYKELVISLLDKTANPFWTNYEVAIDLSKDQLKDMIKFLEDNFDVKGKEIPIEKNSYLFNCSCHSIKDIFSVDTCIEEEEDDWDYFEIRAIMNWNSSCTIIEKGDELKLYSIAKDYLKKLKEKNKKGEENGASEIN